MATAKFILLGSGGHARVVLDSLLSQGANVMALFDPKFSGHLYGIQQKGQYDPDFEKEALAIIAIGDNATRKRLAATTKHSFGNIKHFSVILSERAMMGVGNMLLHGAIIQTESTIGNHVIINTGAQVDHDCVISDYVHLGPGAILCGNATVGEGAFVGAGATVIPGKKVGAWSTVGAGAVVLNDIPDYAVAVGNPARVIKFNTP